MGRTSKFTVCGEAVTEQIASVLEVLVKDNKELAEYLGCSPQAVNQFKKGVARPSLENLSKIADYYHVSTDYILGRTDVSSVNADIQASVKCTGLTEKAVKCLSEMKENESDFLNFVSFIIEEKSKMTGADT